MAQNISIANLLGLQADMGYPINYSRDKRIHSFAGSLSRHQPLTTPGREVGTTLAAASPIPVGGHRGTRRATGSKNAAGASATL